MAKRSGSGFKYPTGIFAEAFQIASRMGRHEISLARRVPALAVLNDTRCDEVVKLTSQLGQGYFHVAKITRERGVFYIMSGADPAQENRCRDPGILITLNEVCGSQSLS